MSEKVDPETLKQRQKGVKEIAQKYGLKPYVDPKKEEAEKEKIEIQTKRIIGKQFSEETKRMNMSKAKNRKPKENVIEEKPPPPYDPYLNDYKQKIDREASAYEQLIEQLQNENEEPYYDSESVLSKLNLQLDPIQNGGDYHMRFAILFQQLEGAEERIEILKNELK